MNDVLDNPDMVYIQEKMNTSQGESGSSAKFQMQNETTLLSQLVQLLGRRPQHMLLLSDLGALLPNQLRAGVKEVGGLRTWLQKFPGLFQVSGQPGKESVALTLGVPGKGSTPETPFNNIQPSTLVPSGTVPPFPSIKPAVGDFRSDPRQEYLQQNTWFDNSNGYADCVLDHEDDRDNASAVQLRGLPYRASVSDILAFLGHHVKDLKEDGRCHAVQLVVNRDGRPSGFARVQFNSVEAAEKCREELHMSTMEDRYVEVFLYNDRPNKVNKRPGKDEIPGAEVEHTRILKPPIDVSHVTRDQVRQEVEEYMQAAGRNRLLLSMLGVALSQEARTFLKKIDQGLKNCLAQYPQIFHVEGTKGCETVSYLPGIEQAEAEMRRNGGEIESASQIAALERTPIRAPQPVPARLQAELTAAGGSPALNPTVLQSGDGKDSAKLERRSRKYSDLDGPASPRFSDSLMATPKGFKTPSDWGTPAIVPDDNTLGAPMQWTAPKHPKPQSPARPPMIPPYGGFGSAPQSWAGPGMTQPMMPFPAWQGLPPAMQPPMQGNWPFMNNLDPAFLQAATCTAQVERMVASVQEGIANVAAAAASAKNQGGSPTPQDEKDQDVLSTAEDKAQANAEKSGAHLHPQNHPFTELADGKTDGLEDGLGAHIPVVRLRGLPFTSSEQDVLAFFSFHNVTEGIVDGDKAVRMLFKANGKPSGQAVVQMQSRRDADNAQQALHSQWMGNRYIEVFSYGGEEDPEELPNLPPLQRDEKPRSHLNEITHQPAPWTFGDAPPPWNALNGSAGCAIATPYIAGEAAYVPTTSSLEYTSSLLGLTGKFPNRPMGDWEMQQDCKPEPKRTPAGASREDGGKDRGKHGRNPAFNSMESQGWPPGLPLHGMSPNRHTRGMLSGSKSGQPCTI